MDDYSKVQWWMVQPDDMRLKAGCFYGGYRDDGVKGAQRNTETFYLTSRTIVRKV